MTGITEEMYQAFKNRFAPEYEKASDMMPVTDNKKIDLGKQVTYHILCHTLM